MFFNYKNMTQTETLSPKESISPDYTMSAQDRRSMFLDIVPSMASELPDDTTNVLIVQSDTCLANYVRSVEAERLPTIPSQMKRYEDASRFMLVLQDKEEGVEFDRPAHTFRVNYLNEKDVPLTTVGLPTFDDALELGLVSAQELTNFYDVPNLRQLGKEYINVETNISIDGVKFSIRKPYSAIGYRAIFELVDFVGVRGVVAYQNPEAIQSLSYMGIIPTPLIGNDELSVQDDDKFASGSPDGRYYPLTVEGTPYSKLPGSVPKHNRRVFSDPEYAAKQSRIAGMIAKKPINVIYQA